MKSHGLLVSSIAWPDKNGCVGDYLMNVKIIGEKESKLMVYE